MADSTILVLGGAGYIGSVLCKNLLERGYRVVCYDSLIYNNGSALAGYWGHENFTLVKADVRDREALAWQMKYADCVVNLAALVGAKACDRDPEGAVAVNRDAAAWVARHLSNRQKLIYANTNSGYGATDGLRPVYESDPLNPISLYGKTKVEAEQISRAEHPDFVSLRLATVCGVSPRMRCDLLVNDLTFRLGLAHDRARNGIESDKLIIYQPDFMRSVVHVEDVCKAILHLIPSINAGIYNVSTWNASKLDIVRNVIDVLYGAASLQDVIPAQDLYEIGDGKDPDGRNYQVSSQKLRSTGYEATRGSLTTEIAHILAYYRTANFTYSGN